MKIVCDLYEKQKFQNVAIALGFFDGMHIGHKKVLNSMMKSTQDSIKAVFTFDNKEKNKKTGTIMTFETKKIAMEKMGIDLLLCPNFDDFKKINPEKFVEILSEKFGVTSIFCGSDFTFGENRSGNIHNLKVFGEKYNIKINIIEPVVVGGEPVSSTRIKKHLLNGEIKQANELLGYTYNINAEVVKGKQLGRTIERPTINQRFENGQLIPKYGAYASVTKHGTGRYYSSSNIGVKPTVGSDEALLETFILDFNQDVYGEEITVYLLDYIREEKKFNSLEDLKDNILDIAVRAKETQIQPVNGHINV